MAGLNIYDILLYLCLFFIIYPFLIYPLLIKLISLLIKTPIRINKSYQPDISIVISAYNEEEYISRAIESIYASDYPKEKIKIFAGSDGSEDRTFSILKDYESKNNNFYAFDFQRGGKNAVLNQLMSKVDTPLVFYFDADCRIEKDTISKLIKILSDENFGAAIARMYSLDEDSDTASYGESTYQKYENFLRVTESQIFSTVGSLGAFYGIKTIYYKPLTSPRVADDFVSLLNVMNFKKRVYFSNEAIVYEYRKKTLQNEFNRKVRISSALYASLWSKKELFFPIYPWVSFTLISHKLLRMTVPFFMIAFLFLFILGNLTSITWLIGFLIILVFGIFAILGFIFEHYNINILLFKFPMLFLTYASAFFMGSIRFLKGTNNSVWSHNFK